MPLQFTNLEEEEPPHNPPATPPTLTTGSSPPFHVPDTPTPATGVPPPAPLPAGFFPPPHPTSGLPGLSAGPSAGSSAGPSAGSLSLSPAGTPQIGLEMLRNEHMLLKSKIDGTKDWAGYVHVSHSDINRYVELNGIINAATTTHTTTPSHPSTSHLTASLDAEKKKLADLAASLRRKEEKILALEKEKGPLEQQLAEAKASLESVLESLEKKKEEFVALHPREADLDRREIELDEKNAALDEREDLLKAGEDGLEAQEEENMAYAGRLMEKMKVAEAAIEKEKELDVEKAALQQQKEALEQQKEAVQQEKGAVQRQKEELGKKEILLKRVDQALQTKDKRLAGKETELKDREEVLSEKEARAFQEAEDVERMKAFMTATTAGQQAQFQEFEKKRAAFMRQISYQTLPAQPSTQQSLLVPSPRQPVLQLQPPRPPQAALIQPPHHQAPSLPYQARQIQPDTSQRVVLGYQFGWDAALPVGVEQGRRKATAETTKLHVENLRKVIFKIRELMDRHKQYMAGAIKVDLNALQKEIGARMDTERELEEEMEMTFDEKMDATMQKEGNPTWEYIRRMGIKLDCPIYFYFPANPDDGAATAGIIKPAPPATTPESLGLSQVVIVRGGPNFSPGQPPLSRASTPAPGPDAPIIQITTPGGTNQSPRTAEAARRGGGGGGRLTASPEPSLLQVPPRNYKRKERERSNSPAPGAAADAGEPARKRLRSHSPSPAVVPAPLRLLAPAQPAVVQLLASANPGTTAASAVYTSSSFAPVLAPAAPLASASQGNPSAEGHPSQEAVDNREMVEEEEDETVMSLGVWGCGKSA
ncbi:hypothetical protein QBC40DRAFT_250009 [Triangularia verruculosa]|uniref:Uncharacterized protein n=1 Tax=Triangularia verruculosa TaxID=2587418 RepID=A0AAN7AZE7_9PEZI|nr:hypothetical protein QBC40DRAFT_250009 [Triangularia verruculosa]